MRDKKKNTKTGIEVSLSNQKKPKEFVDLSQICLDFGQLVNDEVTSDITLVVNDAPPIYAHKIILKMRSPKMLKELSSTVTEYVMGEEHSYQTVVEAVKWMYTGSLKLTDENWKLLLPLADEFGLPKLKDLCFRQMMKKVNINSVLSLILLARSGTEKYYDDIFVKSCVSLLAKKPEECFKSKDFKKLDKQTMIFIVQNDELNIEEITLFDYIIKWGRSQLDGGLDDLNTVLTEDIMKYIRYPLIDSKDLFERCRPTGVVPEEQWIEALELHATGDELPKKYKMRGSYSSFGLYKWSNKQTTFTMNTTTWTGISGTELKKGKHEWHIKLKTLTSTGNSWMMIIGVAKPNYPLNTYLGHNVNGWGYVANGKKNHNSGSGIPYGNQTYAQGDVITVYVDLTKGTIGFKKNGKDLGTAYSNVTAPVCLFVSATCNVVGQLVSSSK
eukprot:gene7523-11847_t